MRIFDMHCDTLTVCKRKGWGLENPHTAVRLSDALDFDSYVQLYAIFIPDTLRGERARSFFSIHHAFYRRQLEQAHGALLDIATAADLQRAYTRRGMSSILSVEGGTVLDGDLEMVQVLHNAGVRCLTLTWNDKNEIAGGMASDGRLTDFGRQAIREMERLHIAVDVSHLNDGSFYDVLDAADAPVAATHSNSRSICPHGRNLTDDMFERIARTGGVVGLNFLRDFIAGDGGKADLHRMAAHVEHFLDLGGEDAVALGSDYDGGGIDACIGRPQKLRDLRAVLRADGLSEGQLDKFFYGNAARFFGRLLSENDADTVFTDSDSEPQAPSGAAGDGGEG